MSSKASIIFLFVFLTLTVNASDNDGVCGYDHKEYATPEEAHNAGTKVMNCGPCGACSTINDVELYWKTKNNLTQETRKCAFFALFDSQMARDCLKEKVPFTDDCMDCWIENIKCTTANCALTCLWSWIIDEPYVDEDGNLNKCLQCDEDTCGPNFKKCAGANRRRACIKSDIMRDDKLICKVCDPFDQ